MEAVCTVEFSGTVEVRGDNSAIQRSMLPIRSAASSGLEKFVIFIPLSSLIPLPSLSAHFDTRMSKTDYFFRLRDDLRGYIPHYRPVFFLPHKTYRRGVAKLYNFFFSASKNQ